MSVSKRIYDVLYLRHHKFKGFLFITKGSSKQHQLLSTFTSCAFYRIYEHTFLRTQILINKHKTVKRNYRAKLPWCYRELNAEY